MRSPLLPELTLLRGSKCPPAPGAAHRSQPVQGAPPRGATALRGQASLAGPASSWKGTWQRNEGQGWNMQGANLPFSLVPVISLCSHPREGGTKVTGCAKVGEAG